MPAPLVITGIELAFTLIEMAIANGELSADDVAARIAKAKASADAAEKRVDDAIKKAGEQ